MGVINNYFQLLFNYFSDQLIQLPLKDYILLCTLFLQRSINKLFDRRVHAEKIIIDILNAVNWFLVFVNAYTICCAQYMKS